MDSTDSSSTRTTLAQTRCRNIQLGLVAALIVVALGLYGWKVMAVNAVETRLAQAEAQQREARAQLLAQAQQVAARRNEAALGTFGIPLAWAVRREMMAGNLDQVNQYFTELMQIDGFESALLALPDGKIVVATDSKQLSRDFSVLYPPAYLEDRVARVERTADGKLRSIVPVLGLSQALGTLVVEYRPAAFSLE